MRFEPAVNMQQADVIIALVPHEEMRRTFLSIQRPDMVGMSATWMRHAPEPSVVWLNESRWRFGPERAVRVTTDAGAAIPSAAARLATYRTYLVNHEVGHALGLGHAPPRGGQCSIMTQQTRLLPKRATFRAWPETRALLGVAHAKTRGTTRESA